MSLDSAVANLVSKLDAISNRLAVVEKQLTHAGEGGGGGGSSGDSSATTREYDDLISQYIRSYVDLSGRLGFKEVVDQAALVLQAVNAQRDMLAIAAQSKKPSDDVFQKLLTPTSSLMQKIVEIRDKGRSSKCFNQLSTVSEGISALGWVCVSPTPGPHVAEMRGGSEFYSNKILVEFKGKDQHQLDWVAAFNGFLKELQNYIKRNHTTGLTWNPHGADASKASPPSTSSGAAPPPPPGPAPPPPVISPSSGATPDMGNVFAALNKGDGVTSGLKKVTNDMKSKNRTDKVSTVPASASKSSESGKFDQKPPSKPPVFSLEGNKWMVENQISNKNLVISDTEAKHTVYIYNCKGSTIQIKGKVNAITVDNCSKTGVVFENCIASFEVVNCNGIEVQVTGKVPSFAIDKTSGCQLFLSKLSLAAEIVTSKSSELNIVIPGDSDSDDVTEVAVPEQYKSTIVGGKLVTEVVAHV